MTNVTKHKLLSTIFIAIYKMQCKTNLTFDANILNILFSKGGNWNDRIEKNFIPQFFGEEWFHFNSTFEFDFVSSDLKYGLNNPFW